MQKNLLPVRLHVSNFRLRIIFLCIIACNIILLWGTSRHNALILVEKAPSEEFVLQQFNLALENVIATWYSSMLLLSVSIMAAICFIADRKRFQTGKERVLGFGWLALSFIFALLSFDEIGSFHEIVNQLSIFKKVGFGNDPGLNAFYTLVGLVGLFMFLFFWIKLKRSTWALLFAAAGAVLFLSHPVQEAYEWHLASKAPDPSAWNRPNLFVLVEEGSEIFGSFCFLLSFTTYAIYATNSSKRYVFKNDIHLSFSITSVRLFSTLAVVIGAIGLFMLYLKLNPVVFDVSDDGIARNWFPSAICFAAALITFYLHFAARKQKSFYSGVFFWIALIFLITSLYFGSNMYANTLLHEAGILKVAQAAKLAANILIGVTILYKIRSTISLIGVGTWMALSFATFHASELHASEIAYISFSCLFLTSILLYLQIQNKKSTTVKKSDNSIKLV